MGNANSSRPIFLNRSTAPRPHLPSAPMMSALTPFPEPPRASRTSFHFHKVSEHEASRLSFPQPMQERRPQHRQNLHGSRTLQLACHWRPSEIRYHRAFRHRDGNEIRPVPSLPGVCSNGQIGCECEEGDRPKPVAPLTR
jgi:hypothetical protein